MSPSTRNRRAGMNPSRPALVPLPNIQPSSSPSSELKTYSRKRKLVDSEYPSSPESPEIMLPSRTVLKKKPKPAQKQISTFFNKPPQQSQLPTPTSSPASSSLFSMSKQPESTIQAKQMTQMHLSNLGAATRTTIHCKICQMQYNKIDPHDQKLHSTHHTSILHGPPFPKPPLPLLNQTTSRIPTKGTLIVISRSSSKDLQKRALSLLSTIDIALGAPSNISRTPFFPHGGKVYTLWTSGRIISLVAAERIPHAYRRMPTPTGIETTGQKEDALIGISRMWTCIAERGKGLCNALLEECAAEFVWGVDCTGKKRDLVAFSTPSESGMGVARKWSGREDFLVYDD